MVLCFAGIDPVHLRHCHCRHSAIGHETTSSMKGDYLTELNNSIPRLYTKTDQLQFIFITGRLLVLKVFHSLNTRCRPSFQPFSTALEQLHRIKVMLNWSLKSLQGG